MIPKTNQRASVDLVFSFVDTFYLLHYVVALDEGADPVKLGLSKDGEHAYMQCVDPGEPYTSGGTVIFDCYRVSD